MHVDDNAFFREATLHICSSLNLTVALKSCFDYVKRYIPMKRISLHVNDEKSNLFRFVAAAGAGIMAEPGQIVYFPEKGQNERAALIKEDLLKDEVTIRIIDPDQMEELGFPEILQKIGLNAKTIMLTLLKLEGNRVGTLTVYADGLNRYNVGHARLLRLLNEPFAIAMSNALRHEEIIRLKDMLADDNWYLLSELRSTSGDKIIGSDFGLKMVMEMVREVAHFDSPVLLLGETGTGKEVIANAIHYSSPRKDGPFIKVNCGAIPETLFDSELFGHEKGAFTGAVSQKRGRFERADKGTIFLDELGELPLQAQTRLLRVLQTKEIERVGGTTLIPVDFRIIAATNRNLPEMVASGQFREDLCFRLNVFPIMIPPLRQRREDIPSLVHHIIDLKSNKLKLAKRPVLGAGAIDKLMSYDWPGNVRELENFIERALIQSRGDVLLFDTLLAPQVTGGREVTRDADRNCTVPSLKEINAQHIRQALEMAGGKINGPGGTAEILGVHPNTLRNRMSKLGIPYGRRSWQNSGIRAAELRGKDTSE